MASTIYVYMSHKGHGMSFTQHTRNSVNNVFCHMVNCKQDVWSYEL